MFSPGDLIIQKHQRGAEPCLVITATGDAGIVVVWGSGQRRYKRIIASGYDLVSPATDASREEAMIEHALSETYIKTTTSKHW